MDIILRLQILKRQTALQLTLGLCVRRGIWKTFSPELKPIKDTKVENILCCSSVFGQTDM